MPQAIRTIDQIMFAEKRDMFFVEFQPKRFPKSRNTPWGRRHLQWFEARDLRWEPSAPRGWLEGDAGIIAVHFAPNDPRIAEYTLEFETPDGTSLHPRAYQAFINLYAPWLQRNPDFDGQEPDWDDETAP